MRPKLAFIRTGLEEIGSFQSLIRSGLEKPAQVSFVDDHPRR